MRRAALLAIAAIVSAFPSSATADDLSSGDSYDRIWFVPHLVGSLSIDASLLQAFSLGGRSTNHPTTSAGISIGWRHFFDGHGTRSVRGFIAYDRGGVFDGGIEGSSHRVGGGLALTARGINQNWVFGALSLVVDGAALIVDPPPRLLLDRGDQSETGFQVGGGLEAMFGSMIVIDPYLFVETGAALSVTHVSLPSGDAWELWGRWLFRFDVAVRGGR